MIKILRKYAAYMADQVKHIYQAYERKILYTQLGFAEAIGFAGALATNTARLSATETDELLWDGTERAVACM